MTAGPACLRDTWKVYPSAEIIAQNMPGAGSVIAANHVFNVGKPDGLTLAMPLNSVYVDQLVGRKEVQFDLRKFRWIGSPAVESTIMYMRADTPFRSVADIIKAKEPPSAARRVLQAPTIFCPGFWRIRWEPRLTPSWVIPEAPR